MGTAEKRRVRLKCEEAGFIKKEKTKNLEQSGFTQNRF